MDSSDDEDNNNDYMYFLAMKRGKHLYDPSQDPSKLCYLGETGEDDDSDALNHDSEDSNRESHDDNDYPDEPDQYSDDEGRGGNKLEGDYSDDSFEARER